MTETQKCLNYGCERTATAEGLCDYHYYEARLEGGELVREIRLYLLKWARYEDWCATHGMAA